MERRVHSAARRQHDLPSTIRSSPPRATRQRARSSDAPAKHSTSAKKRAFTNSFRPCLSYLADRLRGVQQRPQALRSGGLHRRYVERVAVANLNVPAFAQALGARGGATLFFEPTRTGVLSWNTLAPEGRIAFRLLRAHQTDGDWLDHSEWQPDAATSLSPAHAGTNVEVDVISRFAALRRDRSAGARRPVRAARILRSRAFAAVAPLRARRVHSRRTGAFAISLDETDEGRTRMVQPSQSFDDSRLPRHRSPRRASRARRFRSRLQRHGKLGLQRCLQRQAWLSSRRSASAQSRPRPAFDRAQSPAGHFILVGSRRSCPARRCDTPMVISPCCAGLRAAAIARSTIPPLQTYASSIRARAIERIWQRNDGIAYVVAPVGVEFADVLAGS